MTSTVERRSQIVQIVNTQGSIRVEALAQLCSVSSVTIRSDLSYLEKQGYLLRSHGFALPNNRIMHELSIKEKRSQHADVKSLIGQAAVKQIQNGQSIILDSGTTTKEIAANMQHLNDVVVMTSGLDVAMELVSADGVQVRMPGGILRKNALSFSGISAEKSLENYFFDKVFLGVDGYDLKVGITTHNEQEANLNRLMCDISTQIIVVTDSSKFGKRSFHVIREFSGIDMLITDSGIPQEYLQAFQDQGVEVILADTK
ncbi:transcriptional repressor AgaR [Testudinibacter aquarius]|uniref:DeoR family transcriptional regulator n=1 Tax=Testudinibacter aquarius TaxID=1524974 RepID=A0A4R3XY59_9PAST|nr:transcriptional repressor AgaR [Testudinibacter aquarius]TNG95360.1 DeoR family transcriptional regulator [Pasteurellaceae bacterium UScroc12]TNG97641.1 DeoR family transcriptional regulator [Pasteurellaceae bacterium USgator41]TNH01531.1 DeoR family transcriptional regulator [Pasteurellaceae bacterium UScroc31]TNH02630.1 DeoR family transcriptional regulator [Pasteurellaceae bacterium USgator11]KAE9527776.1 transcriptional regulator [Testudinibacter aquarius]